MSQADLSAQTVRSYNGEVICMIVVEDGNYPIQQVLVYISYLQATTSLQSAPKPL